MRDRRLKSAKRIFMVHSKLSLCFDVESLDLATQSECER